MKYKTKKWIFWALILCILLLLISIAALCIGSTNIPISKIFTILFQETVSTDQQIILNIRLPRILLGFAVGGALALAGTILQGMFRNPLVEPYTLGISGGAALGVCINIVLKLDHSIGVFTLPLSGFSGALLVIFLVYILSFKKGVLKIDGMLLTGVMISFIASALLMLFMSMARSDDLHGIIFWIMGSLEEPEWALIYTCLITSISALIITYFYSLKLNALSLGEDEAHHLGINIKKTKQILFLIASLLTGVSVAVTGVIGFVGLLVPHFMRLIIGNDHRILLIGAYLSGACFLILSDTIARIIIHPMELPVGVITGIIGGTLFIYTLNRRKTKI